MTTPEEIERRVEEADTARSAKRATTARQVGELAQHRAAVAEQLDEVERQLGEVLAGAEDVISIAELARFTDISPTDLTRWQTSHRTARGRRRPTERRRTSNGRPGVPPKVSSDGVGPS